MVSSVIINDSFGCSHHHRDLETAVFKVHRGARKACQDNKGWASDKQTLTSSGNWCMESHWRSEGYKIS